MARGDAVDEGRADITTVRLALGGGLTAIGEQGRAISSRTIDVAENALPCFRIDDRTNIDANAGLGRDGGQLL